ncbi:MULTISPECIES: hypothetical protein [Bradyrhizobium]|uniref:hypothetical protein n=1 Tax=Bradyrhizobium TaxID=374 RepID=UPI00293E08B2|nr:hypothetical protein [Bradyrhizobium sp. NDS-1]WOH72269.1 hypothetical protein RX330_28880 [Bradyrhizobium sp. NDS-1]
MRLLIGIACSAGLYALADIAAAQGPQLPGQQSSPADQIKVETLQTIRRSDGYGIASFVLFNGSDSKIESVELACWTDNDPERRTTVLVWANGAISAQMSQQFRNVNIGMVGMNSRSECEVTRVN